MTERREIPASRSISRVTSIRVSGDPPRGQDHHGVRHPRTYLLRTECRVERHQDQKGIGVVGRWLLGHVQRILRRHEHSHRRCHSRLGARRSPSSRVSGRCRGSRPGVDPPLRPRRSPGAPREDKANAKRATANAAGSGVPTATDRQRGSGRRFEMPSQSTFDHSQCRARRPQPSSQPPPAQQARTAVALEAQLDRRAQGCRRRSNDRGDAPRGAPPKITAAIPIARPAISPESASTMTTFFVDTGAMAAGSRT